MGKSLWKEDFKSCSEIFYLIEKITGDKVLKKYLEIEEKEQVKVLADDIKGAI